MNEKILSTDYDYNKKPLKDYNFNGQTFGEQVGMTEIRPNEMMVPIAVMNELYDMIDKGENSLPKLMSFIENIDVPWRIKIFVALKTGLEFDKIHMRKFVEEVHEDTNQATNLMRNLAKHIEDSGPKEE